MVDMNVILARHETPDRLFYAIIDETLKNTRWEEDDALLDFTKPFFQGSVATLDEIEALLADEDVDMLILAGKHVISFFMRKGLIDEEDIIHIAGIPYASVLFETDDSLMDADASDDLFDEGDDDEDELF